MDDYENLSHSKWECKYDGVFIPKYRRKTLYGELRQHLGEVFRRLAIQKESWVEEGHLMPDHVHMMISIQRPHRAALSGPKPKAPGFAGGYLLMQKERKEETIFWGSVYGCDFVEMPDASLTSEPAYRTWCWKTSEMMPKKRSPVEFDLYIRPKMLAATVRPTLAGTEYGIEIEDAIEAVFESRTCVDLDEKGLGALIRGSPFWAETLPDSPNGQELIIKIKPLMRIINTYESVGKTQGHIKRGDVCKRLVKYGRQIAGREGSIERLRCAYALPLEIFHNGFGAVK